MNHFPMLWWLHQELHFELSPTIAKGLEYEFLNILWVFGLHLQTYFWENAKREIASSYSFYAI